MDPVWDESIDDWLEHLRLQGCAATTRRTRRQHLEQLAHERGDVGPRGHTTASLLEWLDDHDWATESRHAARSSLTSFYGWAHATGRVDANPAATIPRVRRRRPQPRPAPDDVYDAALASATPRVALMLRLGGEAGLRRGEIARVHSDDIVDDMVGWSLRVRGKGGAGAVTRTVPLNDFLALDLIGQGPGYIFPGSDHGHLAPQRVGDLLTAALPGHWTGHSLRHRAATRWYRVDRDLLTVRDLLGHSSVATTQLYVETMGSAARHLVVAVS